MPSNTPRLGPVRFAPKLPLLACIFHAAPLALAGGFAEDSSADLELRNMHFHRDFREANGQSRREEWAQGFLLELSSGYTSGAVGFGLDALALLGLRLDSSPDRTGTGLLPVRSDGRAPSDYSKLGLTAKLRAADSELLVGTLLPNLPTLRRLDSRILPQTFQGAMANINEVDGLDISLGRVVRVKDRTSTGSQSLALNNSNDRFGGSFSTDHFDWAGLDYQITDSLKGRYHLAQLNHIYRQQMLGLSWEQEAGPGRLNTELRAAFSTEAGNALAGAIDNQAWQGRLGYSWGAHRLISSLQQMRGVSAFPYISGSSPHLFHFVQLNDFAEPGQRSLQLRYDLDLADLGVPGLSFMGRYIRGDRGRTADGLEAASWERDLELEYQVQSGPLESLTLRLRHGSFRPAYARDVDETRLILSYSLSLL